MKSVHTLSGAALALLLSACAQSVDNNAPYNQGIHLTPAPKSLQIVSEGSWALPNSVQIVYSEDSVLPIADFFGTRWQVATGLDFNRTKTSAQPNQEIRLQIVPTDSVANPEGYLLRIHKDNGATVKASTITGLFRGLQTIEQLFPAEIASPTQVKTAFTLPYVNIQDEPRFRYRGMLVDCSRHFFSIEDLKKIIDVLSTVKINKFHWHLTDDQGWRIEVKKYPKLTEVGSKRTELDGSVYGPFFYTQEQIKELVQYAADRCIDVIPEIEFPGHAQAALAAYPELGCLGKEHNYQVRTRWGVSDQVYCAGNPDTYKFMEEVLAEVIPLFPCEYIHIGGDECPKTSWKKCPKCQQLMKQEGIKTEEELQSYFIHKIEEVVLRHGKKMIGWEEILEGGLAPSATVLSWIGEESGIKSANMGHDIIMAPSRNGLYIDHYQGDPKVEPMAIGGYSTLEKVYSYNPIPDAIAPEKRHHVIGPQCNLWAEYVATPAHQQYMAFPRMFALAEVGWSTPEAKDYNNFLQRLDNLLVRLDYKRVHYHIPLAEQKGGSVNNIHFVDSVPVTFQTTYPVTILYTTDGKEPLASSQVYEKPLTITESTTLKVRSKLAFGKMSTVRTIKLTKEENYTPAAVEANTALDGSYAPGLAYKFYDASFANSDELLNTQVEPTEQGTMPAKALGNLKEYGDDNKPYGWAFVAEGFINIPADGMYVLSCNANDLWLNNNKVITHNGIMQKNSQQDIVLPLAKGLHSIRYTFINQEKEGWINTWADKQVYIKKYGEQKFHTLNSENTYHSTK